VSLYICFEYVAMDLISQSSKQLSYSEGRCSNGEIEKSLCSKLEM